MSELTQIEQQFLDQAYTKLKAARCTLSEIEALQEARAEGYELRLSFDPHRRFVRAEGRREIMEQGKRRVILPHWKLVEQTLANTRLLNELLEGTWDGRNLNEKLDQLEQEDQLWYTFYPHDPRLFQNRQGVWEATGERQIALPQSVKEVLDTFCDRLLAQWLELGEPLPIDRVVHILQELGWTHELTGVHRYLRAWLLTCEQIRRVGQDYWIPAELFPPEVRQTRLHVPPIRTSMLRSVPGQGGTVEDQPVGVVDEQKGKQQREAITFGGTVTQERAEWTVTLLSVHLIGGFLPIPKAVRGIYPPRMPGEGQIAVLSGLWYEDAEKLWLWLDRAHHRLYGPDLLEKIGWVSAGTRLKIEWTSDRVVLHEVGIDPEVQRMETRLADLEELSKLRGGIGESYHQTIQTILLGEADGLTLNEVVNAVSQRQQHEVSRRTIRSILGSGGFLQRDRRWFAAPNPTAGIRQLQEALLETLVPPDEGEGTKILSPHDYVRTRAQAIHQRLRTITSLLREHST